MLRAVHVADKMNNHDDVMETERIAEVLMVLEFFRQLVDVVDAVLYKPSVVVDSFERNRFLVSLECMRISRYSLSFDRVESYIDSNWFLYLSAYDAYFTIDSPLRYSSIIALASGVR